MLRVALAGSGGVLAGLVWAEANTSSPAASEPAQRAALDAEEVGQGGQFSDFGDYVSARLPTLLRFGHALTGNPHDANDLVQEVLEKVGVRWNSLQRRGVNVDAYVRRAMSNTRTSRWRRRRRETLVAFVPDIPVAQRDRLDDEPLWRALKRLPPKQRAVLVLRYYEDLSEAEIAEALGISAGTVKSHTSRAMAALRRELGPVEGGASDDS